MTRPGVPPPLTVILAPVVPLTKYASGPYDDAPEVVLTAVELRLIVELAGRLNVIVADLSLAATALLIAAARLPVPV